MKKEKRMKGREGESKRKEKRMKFFLLPYWHIRKLIIFVNSICLVWSCCYISVVFGSIFLSTNVNYFFCFQDFDDYISFIIIL